MTQTSAIPQQIFSIIKNYYADSRAKNLAYIELEYCFEDGTEDAWIEKLDKAMAPLIKHVELSLISLIRPANNLLKKIEKQSIDAWSLLLRILIPIVGIFMLNLTIRHLLTLKP